MADPAMQQSSPMGTSVGRLQSGSGEGVEAVARGDVRNRWLHRRRSQRQTRHRPSRIALLALSLVLLSALSLSPFSPTLAESAIDSSIPAEETDASRQEPPVPSSDPSPSPSSSSDSSLSDSQSSPEPSQPSLSPSDGPPPPPSDAAASVALRAITSRAAGVGAGVPRNTFKPRRPRPGGSPQAGIPPWQQPASPPPVSPKPRPKPAKPLPKPLPKPHPKPHPRPTFKQSPKPKPKAASPPPAVVLSPPPALPVPVARPPPAAGSGLVRLVLLGRDKSRGRCLDGSRAGYYFRRGYGTGADKWLILLEGGGWCFSVKSCVGRSKGPLGSSLSWPTGTTKAVKMSGIASADPRVSPDFYNWNVATIRYCDGGSFSGSFGKHIGSNRTLFFMGHYNLQGALSDMLATRGLATAKAALVGGCSAGGQAVSMMCDPIAAYLGQHGVKTKCFMDAGFFLDARDINGKYSFRQKVRNMFGFQNLERLGLNVECRAAMRKLNQTWRCFFPQYNIEFVRTPLFIINSNLDYKAVALTFAPRSVRTTNAVLRCLHKKRGACNQSTIGALEFYRASLRAALKYVQVQARVRSRNFAVKAYEIGDNAHCVVGTDGWLNTRSIRAGALDLRTALRQWFYSQPVPF